MPGKKLNNTTHQLRNVFAVNTAYNKRKNNQKNNIKAASLECLLSNKDLNELILIFLTLPEIVSVGLLNTKSQICFKLYQPISSALHVNQNRPRKINHNFGEIGKLFPFISEHHQLLIENDKLHKHLENIENRKRNFKRNSKEIMIASFDLLALTFFEYLLTRFYIELFRFLLNKRNFISSFDSIPIQKMLIIELIVFSLLYGVIFPDTTMRLFNIMKDVVYACGESLLGAGEIIEKTLKANRNRLFQEVIPCIEDARPDVALIQFVHEKVDQKSNRCVIL